MKKVLMISVLLVCVSNCGLVGYHPFRSSQPAQDEFAWMNNLTPEQARELLQMLQTDQMISEAQWQTQLMMAPVSRRYPW